MLSYSGGLNSCCSSCEHSLYTVVLLHPLCMDIVQSTYHIHPLAWCHWCHKHTADSPGSFDAPGCGNRDGKSHSDDPLRIPIKEVKMEEKEEQKQRCNSCRKSSFMMDKQCRKCHVTTVVHVLLKCPDHTRFNKLVSPCQSKQKCSYGVSL